MNHYIDHNEEEFLIDHMGRMVPVQHKPRYIPVQDKSAYLNDLSPHYLHHHSAFNGGAEVLIFGGNNKKIEGMRVDYADRLREWDRTAYENAHEQMKESTTKPKTALWIEEWLSHYHGKPVTIHAIWSSYSPWNGYPYSVYGYVIKE